MKMKALPRVDLPREKLERYGLGKLADHELLALLLGSGIKGKNVLQLSRQILKSVKERGFENVTIETLLAIKGLGKAKASQVLAALELGARLTNAQHPEVLSAEDVWNLCTDIRASRREHFVAFYLDTQNRLIERVIISIGTLTESVVHPREVFEPAVRLCAASIILAHNHPSGTLQQSNGDGEVTKRLRDAGSLLGISILDHVIVTRTSFRTLTSTSLTG